MDNETPTTRRDELLKSFEAVEQSQPEAPAIVKDAPIAPEKAQAEAPVAEAEGEKRDGRTAGRPRDEKGRLLPGKPEKDAVAAAPKADTAPKAQSGTEPAATAPERPRPKYPSTWKKDYLPKWETVDPDLAEEIARREADYAKGVSTYKAEYDRIKPIEEALKPFAPFMQHAGVKPEAAVSALFQNDQTLRFGTPEQKLQTLARLIQDYQLPVHQLLVQGEDGKVYFNQNYFQQQAQQHAQQGITPQDVERIVAQRMQAAQLQAAVQQFTASRDASGNPLYPHFETVKGTMRGILQAGLAPDLPSAYEAALRMPQHADLFEAQQKQQRETEQAAQLRAKAEAAAKARAQAVSTKSQPTTGTVTTATNGRKSRLEELSENFDHFAGSSGRV